ncbi:LysM peptidoglycan-binding domain-containing protein [soil metagenome]
MSAFFLVVLAGCTSDQSYLEDALTYEHEDLVAAKKSKPTQVRKVQVVTKCAGNSFSLANLLTRRSSHDFWGSLRSSFKLRGYCNNPAVYAQIQWYHRNQADLDISLKRAATYMYFILEQIRVRHLPGELALIPVIESAYNPYATSSPGAGGLWQLMPDTASGYGVKQNWWYDGRRDIYASTKAALDHFSYLQTFFEGNWLLSLAAYDAGEGKLMRAIRHNAREGKTIDFWSLSTLPGETKSYVPRLLALALIIDDPKRFGFILPPINNGPIFTAIQVGIPLDLHTAAQLAGISVDQMRRLNPCFSHGVTHPTGGQRIVLPIDKVAMFKTNLANIPTEKRLAMMRYEVRKREPVSKLAERFKTSLAMIRQINNIQGLFVHKGEVLVIPHKPGEAPLIQLANNNQTGSKSSQVAIVGAKKVTHLVVAGDTLVALAEKYCVKAGDICEWNNLEGTKHVTTGKRLVIWVKAPTKTNKIQLVSKVKNSKTTVAGLSVKHYKVRSGDTISTIAQRNKVSIADLKNWNQGLKKILQPGQVIVLKVKKNVVV